MADLPALVIADARRDVRGWEIQDDNGRVLGVVSDVLADPDQLVAPFLVVAPAETGAAEVFVPIEAVAAGTDHLCIGRGRQSMEPIKLRFRSTVSLTARAAVATAVLFAIWSLGLAAC